MFSLIISIISVALVVVLSLATLYYFNGGLLSKTSTEAKVAKLTNETSQIQSAIEFYRSQHKGALPPSLEALTENGEYLRQLPSGSWTSNVAYIQTSSDSIEEPVCLAFNTKRGIPFIPACNDDAFRSVMMCCSEAPE